MPAATPAHNAKHLAALPLKSRLEHIVTRFDRREAERAAKNKRGYYNVYALAVYLRRVDDIVADVEAGHDLRKAILAGFNDRLCDYVLQSLGLPKASEPETETADAANYRACMSAT